MAIYKAACSPSKRKRDCGCKETGCCNRGSDKRGAKPVSARKRQVGGATGNGQPREYRRLAQHRHVTESEHQISCGEHQHAQTMAGVKPDPRVPKVGAPGE